MEHSTRTEAEAGHPATPEVLLGQVPPEELLRLFSERLAGTLLGRPPGLPWDRATPAPIDEPARFSLFEEILAPDELSELEAYVAAHERGFRRSQVIAQQRNEGVDDPNHRKSRVLFEVGPIQALIERRLRTCLNQIFRSLDHPPFTVATVEAQITASNDGEYFRTHNDNTHQALQTRELTYVLFFHREPRPFLGGELRLYDSRAESGRWVAGTRFTAIAPERNTAVFFPSHFMHEVATVHCPSRAFGDSRFTLNGWLHR
jgi:Rps23 Pro-64 3,4-dihydroxylase Tpa1-like proline 4-hydroxylase